VASSVVTVLLKLREGAKEESKGEGRRMNAEGGKKRIERDSSLRSLTLFHFFPFSALPLHVGISFRSIYLWSGRVVNGCYLTVLTQQFSLAHHKLVSTNKITYL
jgi:hypothetical protein